MLRKLNKSNDYPIRIRDPDDPSVTIDDPVIIKDKLTKYWSNLGDTNKTNNEDLGLKVDQLENASATPESFHSISLTAEHVHHAIQKLKNGKAVGPDRIPGEFVKYGGLALQEAVLKLFCKIRTVESIPSEWYEGLVKPLFKEGSKEILSNYRGITISSVIYKVLVRIIEKQSMSYLEDHNVFGDSQGAFRKNRRCEDHIYSLKGICTVRKNKKQNTFLAFLDVSKAFDTIDRVKLFSYIWEKGIQGKAWRMIRMLYRHVNNKVIFGKFESESFEVLNGVKQGCIMSPCLFNIAMSDLQNMLHECPGVNIGDTTVHGLFYADDIVLIAKNDHDLTQMLQVADTYSRKWGLRFNSKKSQILVVGKRITDKQWPLGDMMLKETNSYKYLGVIINRRLNDSDHINVHLAEKAKKLQAYLRYTLSSHMDINRVTFGNTLWHKALLPSLSHACGIWFNDTLTTRKNIMSFQYKCAKAVLKLKCMPARSAILADLGWLPIIDHLDTLRACYFEHLHKMEDSRLTKIVFNELSQIPTNNQVPFKYFKNIKNIFQDRGMDHMFLNKDMINIDVFKQAVNASYFQSFTKDIEERTSLLTYKYVKYDTFCSEYLTCDNGSFKAKQLKFKLRTGVLGLGADLVRQHRGQGDCKMCGEYESATHFIFKCPAYNNLRECMMKTILQCTNTQMFNYFIQDTVFALCTVLGCHDDVFNSSFLKYIDKAWAIRSNM